LRLKYNQTFLKKKKKQEEKIKKRNDAKITRQSSRGQTQIVVALVASAGMTGEPLSVVLR
jgi:hypothetical protein